jgi:superfamily II DNA or RNA helicase
MKSNQYPYNFRVGSNKTPQVKTSFAQVYTPVKASQPIQSKPVKSTPNKSQPNKSMSIQSTPKPASTPKYSKKASISIELPKTANTYLGPKGYTIYKSDLTETQIQYVKDALTIKPVTPGITLAATTTFPSYRESAQKLYVPRCFGITNFGIPKATKITPGEDIDVPFVGVLRDYQQEVVAAYVKACADPVACSGGLVNLPCGYGKTTVSLNIVSTMRKKTLIIVHKEFLLNQWVERIQQYLPTARIGRIQGQTIDIENKDVVIGMLQSLSMKEYDDNVFSSFGLLLIDEVHHIGSEVFSCALFKIVTQYTLGLSATMDRKDGTTYVFKMFLGDIVYKIAEKKQRHVQVRAIQFQGGNADPVFSRVEYDFRGNPAYSTMISKLCEYTPRSEFIIRVIQDMFAENGEQQIMVIAHNKNVLTYIHDAIAERNIASVGYYIGGMKESSLKITESKQVVIATYAMAAEALDIKTLCTLIMVTPKTDIEQSVGRILRSDHEMPVVVDIVDSHEPFQKQWAKRRAFYKKENYKIYKVASSAYMPPTNGGISMPPGWELVYEPKVKPTCKKDDVVEVEEDEEDEDKPKGNCLINVAFDE